MPYCTALVAAFVAEKSIFRYKTIEIPWKYAMSASFPSWTSWVRIPSPALAYGETDRRLDRKLARKKKRWTEWQPGPAAEQQTLRSTGAIQ